VYHNFIGIDISKNDFYVAIHGDKAAQPYANNHIGFNELFKIHTDELVNGLVVLETTGGYEAKLIEFLQSNKVAVHRANTRIVKSFIRSTGKLGKSDKIDAIGLARYAKERHTELNIYKPQDAMHKELLQLSNRLRELKVIRASEKNRAKAPDNEFIVGSCSELIDNLSKLIEQVESRMQELIALDEHMQDKVNLLSAEIDGVGNTTAVGLLINMPELGSLDRRKAASLSGTAPHPYESGKKVGYRNTRGGRQVVKTILFMAAMAASRTKGKLGQFYQSLIAKGKKPMVALTALMRKIIVIANAKLKNLQQNIKFTVVNV
jgi:transposase